MKATINRGSHGRDFQAQAHLGLVVFRLGQSALSHAAGDLCVWPLFRRGCGRILLSGTGLDPQAAAAQAQTVWANCLTITGLIIAFGAPLVGAMADVSGRRIPWIFAFSVMYAVGSAALWYTLPDGSNMWLMLSAFGLGFVGAEYALIFINSQLPDLGDDNEVGEISGSGFAFGYFGGLISLAIMLTLFVEQPNGKTLIGMDPIVWAGCGKRKRARGLSGPFTAGWFVLFMVPYFLWVRDDPEAKKPAVWARRCACWANRSRTCGTGSVWRPIWVRPCSTATR